MNALLEKLVVLTATTVAALPMANYCFSESRNMFNPCQAEMNVMYMRGLCFPEVSKEKLLYYFEKNDTYLRT